MAVDITARDGAASFGKGVDAIKACKVYPIDTLTKKRRWFDREEDEDGGVKE